MDVCQKGERKGREGRGWEKRGEEREMEGRGREKRGEEREREGRGIEKRGGERAERQGVKGEKREGRGKGKVYEKTTNCVHPYPSSDPSQLIIIIIMK